MADLFQDRSCMHWWLPNDENYPPIVRSIRKFVEERTSPAKSEPAEDLRDMKAIFASMNLEGGHSELPSPTATRHDAPSESTQHEVPRIDHKGLKGAAYIATGDPYRPGFGATQDFWGGGQGGDMDGSYRP